MGKQFDERKRDQFLRNAYRNMGYRTKLYDLEPIDFTVNEFIEKYIDDPIFVKMHGYWLENDMETEIKPSVDRKNNFIGYLSDNIQFLTVKENKDKGYKENKNRNKRVLMTNTKTGKQRIYNSAWSAAHETGINRNLIFRCCTNEFESVYGFSFKFVRRIGNKYRELESDEWKEPK